jgi:class 3 adenylate cyclase
MTGPALRGAVLFTDIVGFTEYTDARGDAAALALLDRQSAIVAGVLASSGGRVVKELGDGLLVWFDDVSEAVQAATALHRAITAARNAGTFPLALRMGMHCGEVVPRGDDVVGHTVNIAARIADLAGPDEFLISDAVVVAASSAISTRPVGPTHVRGVAEPIWIHRLVT